MCIAKAAFSEEMKSFNNTKNHLSQLSNFQLNVADNKATQQQAPTAPSTVCSKILHDNIGSLTGLMSGMGKVNRCGTSSPICCRECPSNGGEEASPAGATSIANVVGATSEASKLLAASPDLGTAAVA
jgi:hypothetical protein